LLDQSEIIIAKETHLTHKPYLPNLNTIQSKYASSGGVLQISQKTLEQKNIKYINYSITYS
jgi:hypothetical protein